LGLVAVIWLGAMALEHNVLAQTGLAITNVSQSVQTVPLYEKFEVTFNVLGTVAKNLQWPCDTKQTYPVSGVGKLPSEVGISVDGVFQNGTTILRQPAFLYTPYNFVEASDFYHPSGIDPVWMIRFAPQQTGNWTFHIEARDGVGCTRFIQSANYSFTVTSAQAGNHGFVKVSQTDKRYFEYTDGTPFIGVGHASNSDGDIATLRSTYANYKQNGVNFVRIWMDQAIIWGQGVYNHGWDAWAGAINYRTNAQKYGLGDFSVSLANGQSVIQPGGGQYHNSSLDNNTTYKLRLRARLTNVTGTAGNGLVVQIPGNTAIAFTGNDTDWKVYEQQFTNTTRRNMDGLAIRMQNAGSGVAYLDEVYIGVVKNASTQATIDDLSLGLAPNLVFKPKVNYQNYYDEVASQKYDRVMDLAKQDDLYLKLVISDMRDGVVRCITLATGIFNPNDCQDDNFLSLSPNAAIGRNTKVRRLQEYYWRYLTARWGYVTNVHSWELTNEGPPGNDSHNDNAQDLAEVMLAIDPNKHMANTSYWSDFDSNFFNDPATKVEYADYHAYQSPDSNASSNTGWLSGSQWNYLTNDTADYHYQYAKSARGMLTASRTMPMVRGEGGLTDNSSWNASELAAVYQDKYGVWLHNFVWAGLNEYAAYELYWWDGAMNQNNLRFQYKPFRDYMTGVTISNGKYQAAAPTISASNVRVFGQKDSKGQAATHAVMWIQNKNHTWNNVVNNSVTGQLNGTVTLSGFQSNTAFPVEWWDFTTVGSLTKHTSTAISNTSGNIILDLNSYTSTITDTAIKIGDFSQGGLPGDANGDRIVDGLDYVIWLINYNTNTASGPSKGDFNRNGLVDGLDYVIWLNNFGI